MAVTTEKHMLVTNGMSITLGSYCDQNVDILQTSQQYYDYMLYKQG